MSRENEQQDTKTPTYVGAVLKFLATGSGVVAIVMFLTAYSDLPRRVGDIEKTNHEQDGKLTTLTSAIADERALISGDSATLKQVDDRTKRIESTLDRIYTK